MNYQMIGFVIGRILLTEAALLMLPMAVALVYGEAAAPFLLPALLLALIFTGLALLLLRVGADVRVRRIALCPLRGHSEFRGRLF